MAKEQWTTISIRPLTGVLDLRSRPADLPPGAFRYKLNWATSDTGNLCRRAGHQRFYAEAQYDNLGQSIADPNHTGTGVFYHNHDHHHQGATREPITLLYESTDTGGNRRLFDGTQSRLSVLDESTGYWSDIASGLGSAGARWSVAELKDTLIATNNVDAPRYHVLGSSTAQVIPDLGTREITAARVAVQFQGFILLMNIVQSGTRAKTKIAWCDLNLPLSWVVGAPDSLAGFQDLPYGDEILAAKELLGSLYIYTRRSIWKCTLALSSTSVFSFVRVYNEPKNQKGCLTFPNTLVSDGSNHWYLSRDAWYKYNPFIAAPERDDRDHNDWMHRATGAIYTNPTTRMNGLICDTPVAEYVPSAKEPSRGEIWVSWPSGGSLYNNNSLVVNLEQKTADLVDAGFSAFVNYRRTPTGTLCNEVQDFLGVSSLDWAIKSIGNVYFREVADWKSPTDITVDLDLNAPSTTYKRLGYYSILRGLMPLGFTDRQKLFRKLLIDSQTSDQDSPCFVKVRIGTSVSLCDPNDQSAKCSPLWRTLTSKPLTCPASHTNAQMRAGNLEPDLPLIWKILLKNVFLYYEITIINEDGTPAIGADTAMQRIDFDVRALPRAGY